VLGIGEIGLNKNTKNEATIFLEHVELAVKHDQQILIHTPHLEDKYQGTRMILDMLCGDSRPDRSTACSSTTSRSTRCGRARRRILGGDDALPDDEVHAAAGGDIVEMYGPERLMVNSAGDWGPSKPTAVPDFILEMRRRGHPESLIRRSSTRTRSRSSGKAGGPQLTPNHVRATCGRRASRNEQGSWHATPHRHFQPSAPHHR
jgi:uncharacterized protein